MAINFREIFFDQISDKILGYSLAIEIKPAHLANGFFRAVCNGYVNNTIQHKAIYPKKYPNLIPGDQGSDNKQKSDFENLVPQQQEALRFLNDRERDREMLFALLQADRTIFTSVNTSSYTLSHAGHVTSDNHDRKTGIWLHNILAEGSENSALKLLQALLQEEPRHRSDELSVLTLPLDDPAANPKSLSRGEWQPESLRIDPSGQFADPLICAIRKGFDQLAEHDSKAARYNGKLDALRRFVTWGCFAVYLHLANIGETRDTIENQSKRVPMLLRIVKPAPTLHQASIESYQWVRRSIDKFFRREILKIVTSLADSQEQGIWSTDEDIERHILHTINWFSTATGPRKKNEAQKVEEYKQKCLQFYYSYRGETGAQSPIEAAANAITDMLRDILSSEPKGIARALAMRIGFLSMYGHRELRPYTPQPDFLEVLVRASIPGGTTWTLVELARYWAEEYGILFGALGDENRRLADWGIRSVDRNELARNVDALAEILEMSGYARRYADGVVLVSVDQ